MPSAITSLFYVNNLSLIMMSLVLMIGITICFFSKKYMAGDLNLNRFMILLSLLCVSATLLFTADNLFLLFTLWGLTQHLLIRLMGHYQCWNAAVNSSRLASKSLGSAGIFIALAFTAFYLATSEVTVQAIIHDPDAETIWINVGLGFLLLGVSIQSAIWPFHRWLLSSMNAPTPISAMMHAGLINGGGYLLALFSRLYFNEPLWLTLIFILGLMTAVIGILWKLIQPDIKRMLACSTMGQMGFMFTQCGLGLFPAAIAHLCWHGMFKAYLFLSSGSGIRKPPIAKQMAPSISAFFIATCCGIVGTIAFIFTSGEGIPAFDSRWVLLNVVLISGIQLALSTLESIHWKLILSAFAITTTAGLLYGASVGIFYNLLPELSSPTPLNSLHIAGMCVLSMSWLSMLLANTWIRSPKLSVLIKHIYMQSLNSSQPHPSTITAHRNDYNYL